MRPRKDKKEFMNQQNNQTTASFNLNFIDPYTTFDNGEAKYIPYVIDGLLTEGGFSLLGGKSKDWFLARNTGPSPDATDQSVKDEILTSI